MRKGLFILFMFLYLLFLINSVKGTPDIKFYQLTNITNNAEGGPSWNFDGSEIVYDSGIDYTSGGLGKGLWTMNSDGTNQKMIVDPADSPGSNNVHADWSPVGDSVVFVRDKLYGGGGIWIVNSNGTNEHRITFSSGLERYPDWSPDGTKIVYSGASYGLPYEIWVMDLNESKILQLSDNSGDFNGMFPTWSKDGSKIIYTGIKDGNVDIWVMNSDGSNHTRITFNNSVDINPDINYDGRIVFESNRAGNIGYDLWIMNIDGTELFQLTNWSGNEFEAEWSPDGKKIAFSWDRKPGGYQVMDIWIAELSILPQPPLPTNHSMIISSPAWQDVLAAVPARVPLIVSDGLTGNVQRFIDDYGPDNIYTLGMDLGLANSYQIGPGDVPGLFFPNETRAVYADDRDSGVIASQLAYYLGIPLVFDSSGWDPSRLIDLTGLTGEDIQELYIDEVKNNGDGIDYLVLANLENESSLLAGRVAGMRGGLVVPVRVSGIEYAGDPYEANHDNGVFGIWQGIVDAAGALSGQDLFAGSPEYRKGGPLYLAIVGDGYSIPFALFRDPGLEVLNDRDGDRLYTDLIYADLNNDSHFDLSVGRFLGNLTGISLQLERLGLPKEKDAVLIGQYRHRSYQDMQFQGGGMAQAYSAQLTLDAAGFQTRRIVENRSESPVSVGLNDMLKVAMFHYGIKGTRGIAGTLTCISLAWGIAEIGEVLLYAYLEHDWGEWLDDLKQGSVTAPGALEVLYPDTDLGQPRILGYFGVGDRHWTVPPDDKDDIELMTVPYIRATPMEDLDFSNFLYDDHDMSAGSDIDMQVLSGGGMAAGSSGIVHDPYTMYYSGLFFDSLARGKPVGEAMRDAVNNVVPKNPLSLFDLFFRSGEIPNLYFKTKYERLLLGDPAYRPVEEGIPEHEYVFTIRPYNSYLAEALIESDYVIKKGRVYVHNADDYLVESGKPLIPMFVRELVLPEGSGVQDIRFTGFYRSYWWVKPVVLPWDEYYEEGPEGFSGRYPEDKYWYRTSTLLDGRTLVRVYVPGVTYSSGRTRVLKRGRLSVEYESPVEVMVNTRDIKLGQAEKIRVKVSNGGDEALPGTLWVWVGGEEYSRPLEVGAGETARDVFTFTPGEAGDYQVKALFDAGVSSGPRYSDFGVYKPCKWPWERLPFWLRRFLWSWRDRCCDPAEGLSDIPLQ